MQATPETIVELFREPVPTVEEFTLDPFFLGTLVRPCSAQIETLKKIFPHETPVNTVGLMWGIGAGKSFLVSVALAYLVYRTLCLRDPAKYYGLAPGTQIAFVNFSVTSSQAQSVVFQEIASRVDLSPAFDRLGFRRDQIIRSCLRWPESNISVFPGTSQSRSALGYNVLGAAIDEASWFQRQTLRRQQADVVEDDFQDSVGSLAGILRERMASRGGNERWRRDSLLLAISSPRSRDDWLYTVKAEAVSTPQTVFAELPTWEGFPSLSLTGETFDDPVCKKVPIEYKSFFDRDPMRARRNLGAVAPDVFSGFFSRPEIVRGMFEEKRENIFTPGTIDTPGGLREDYVPCCSGHRFVHIDLGVTRDSCGLVAAHNEGDHLIVDGTLRLEPCQFQGEIDLAYPRDVVMALAEKVPVSVSYDGFQSLDSRQLLRRHGIDSTLLSVDRTTGPYDVLKGLLAEGKVHAPVDDHLAWELENLEYDATRGKVDHQPGKSKDVADALAGAIYSVSQAMLPGGREVLLGIGDVLPGFQPVVYGAARL